MYRDGGLRARRVVRAEPDAVSHGGSMSPLYHDAHSQVGLLVRPAPQRLDAHELAVFLQFQARASAMGGLDFIDDQLAPATVRQGKPRDGYLPPLLLSQVKACGALEDGG